MQSDHALHFYIDGAWIAPISTATQDVINPATESPFTTIAMGNAADVDRAMAAARRAFPMWTRTSKPDRLDLLRAIHAEYTARWDDIAQIVADGFADLDRARRVARKMRAGTVSINWPEWDTSAPFGGYKQSGNGREYADFGIREFLETKGLVGYGEA